MTFLYCEPFAVFIVGTERRTWGWRGIVGVCCQLVWGSERVFLITVCPVIPEQDGLELGLIFREMQQRWERPQTWASGQDWWFKLVLEHRGREGSEAIEVCFFMPRLTAWFPHLANTVSVSCVPTLFRVCAGVWSLQVQCRSQRIILSW